MIINADPPKERPKSGIIRLLVIILGILTLLQVGIGTMVIHFVGNNVLQKIEQNAAQHALEEKVWILKSHLNDRLTVLRGYSRLQAIEALIRNPLTNQSYANKVLQALPLIDRLPCYKLLDLKNRPLYSTGTICSFNYTGAQAELAKIADGRSLGEIAIVSKREFEQMHYFWVLAVPVIRDGRPIGILTATVPVNFGSLMAGHPDTNLLVLKSKSGILASWGRRQQSSVPIGAPLHIQDISISLHVSTEDVSKAVKRMIWAMTIALVIMTSIVVITALRLGRKLLVVPHDDLLKLHAEIAEQNKTLSKQVFENEQTMTLLEYKSLMLEEQEALVRDVVEDQTEMICRFNENGILTFANHAYSQFFGKKREDLVGKEYFSPLDSQEHSLDACVLDSSADRPIRTFALELKNAQGESRWVEWKIRLTRHDDISSAYQAVGRDMTEAKRLQTDLLRSKEDLEARVMERTMDLSRLAEERQLAERQAREKETLLRAILDGIKAAFVVVHTPTFLVVAVNHLAEDLLQQPASEILGRTYDLYRAFGKKQSDPSAMQGEGSYTEERLAMPDGRSIPVAVHYIPVDAEHRAVIIRDISLRINLERQLNMAQKLESIGQLAAGIAHEINTPIQFVGDSVRFIKDAFDDVNKLLVVYAALIQELKNQPALISLASPVEATIADIDLEFLVEEVPKACDRALEGTDRVAKIVLAMKNFSHPGTEEKKPIDLNKALDTTATVAKNEWKYVADVELKLDPTLPLVPCLPGDMNQVFLNILVNAAHAIGASVGETGAKGKITVSTRRNDSSVEVAISDTGSGIPKEHRGKVFDPFFTTKEVGRGTGQGLAIAHDIVVNKHGGTIDFTTEPGIGTTFFIRLPLEDPHAK